jgi:hypothetical protein
VHPRASLSHLCLSQEKDCSPSPHVPFRLSLRTVFHPTPDALRRSPRSRGPPRAVQPIVGYPRDWQVGPFGRDDSRVWRLGDKAAEWAERIGSCWKKALRQSSRRARRFARSIRFTATPRQAQLRRNGATCSRLARRQSPLGRRAAAWLSLRDRPRCLVSLAAQGAADQKRYRYRALCLTNERRGEHGSQTSHEGAAVHPLCLTVPGW